jgi:ankyrin repeat protein
LAAFKGDTETAKRLVAQGANVNSVSKAGDTPDHGSFQGNTEIAKLLIAKGRRYSARNKAGKNAQALANENNHVETYHAITTSKQVSIEAALSRNFLETKKIGRRKRHGRP